MKDSIFTKIVRGEIPSHKIYEDDKVYAFLDIHPVQPGHTLVIPKKQVKYVWDMEDVDYQAVMAVAKKLAKNMREKLQKPYVGEIVEGLDVPHAHVHLIPFSTAEEFHTHPDMTADPDHKSLEEIAKKLAL